MQASVNFICTESGLLYYAYVACYDTPILGEELVDTWAESMGNFTGVCSKGYCKTTQKPFSWSLGDQV